MHRSLPLFVAALAMLPAEAQLEFPGTPIGRDAAAQLPPVPVAEMPAVDAAALLLEDMEREAAGIKGPWRFGFNHATDLTLDNSGVWHTQANGDRIWRLSIHCPAAFSINFEFNTWVVPDGGKVFVWNQHGETIGAFTAQSNPGHTELGVTQLRGDRITIEYQEPAARAGEGQLRIGQVTHAYRDIFKQEKGLGDSGSCNINTICPEGDDWRDEISSVAMITIGGSGICTGQLINNCANDGTPYFLTANHCTSGANVGTWVFRFKWESPVCGSIASGPINRTVAGSTLLVNSTSSDVALLELSSAPLPWWGVYYNGWDASGDIPATQVCIHHPSGDIKKITFNNDPANQTSWGSPPAQCWNIPAWDDGTTEGGSSGSALWNEDHLIIGQLYGGIASCSNNIDDYFGRFNVSYPLLDNWLDPSGTCGPTLSGFTPVSVNEMAEADFTVALVPNPASTMVRLQLPTDGRQANISLTDASGRVVLRDRTVCRGEHVLAIDRLVAGIYAVSVEVEGARATSMLAVN